MKKFRKALLLCVAFVLVAAIAIAGTIAYLTDNDSAVNVMTLGNVDIEQIEQEHNADGELVDFTQAKPLYPYVGELGWGNTEEADGAYRSFTMNNVVDKYVSVKNTGKSDAFVRTVFAFEMGIYETIEAFRNKIIGISRNTVDGDEFDFEGAWVWGTPFVAEINGENYMVWEAVHESALAPKATTIPSLLQVYMNKTCGNEEVTAVDGNANGFYDIHALSQAVQTEGFADAQTALDEAFGKVSKVNAVAWFEGTSIPVLSGDQNEIKDALNKGQDTYLEEDEEIDADQSTGYGKTGIIVDKGVTFDGQGNTIDVNGANATWDCGVALLHGTVKNVTVNGCFRGIFMPGANGDVYVENCVLDNVCYTFNSDDGNKKYGVYISDTVLNGWTSYSDVHKEVVFTNCSFGKGSGGYSYAFLRPYNVSTFKGCNFSEGYEIDPRAELTFIDCYYNGQLITADNLESLGLIVVSGDLSLIKIANS